MSEKYIKWSFYVAFLVAALGFGVTLQGKSREAAYETREQVAAAGKVSSRKLVVIDPGHGGFDPGKIGNTEGETEVYEKDRNLAVAHKLASYLEQNDIQVVMTREEDVSLDETGEGNQPGNSLGGSRKARDMKARVAVMEEYHPDAVVSIHQNSYPDPKIKGAQVFYYNASAQGRLLAECVQGSLKKLADPKNNRNIKANSEYYLLKKTKEPIVIAECGFLSNPTECGKLCTPEYTDRLAWAVAMGVLEYLNRNPAQQL